LSPSFGYYYYYYDNKLLYYIITRLTNQPNLYTISNDDSVQKPTTRLFHTE